MTYEIQNKNDFLTGSSLTIRVPEKEIDYNALRTIQKDCPEFIVPFHYKAEGGYIELTYKIGTQCKLQYFAGEVAPKEYSKLWQSLLRPLLDCKDWFMNPSSFVLSADYLYYDKNRNACSYIYIPSMRASINSEDFYKMSVDVSKMITVSDATLENKILKAIIKDYDPIEFLQMLAEHESENDTKPELVMTTATPLSNTVKLEEQSSVKEPRAQVQQAAAVEGFGAESYEFEKTNENAVSSQSNDFDDDIIIDFKSMLKPKSERKNKEKESRGSKGYKIFSGRGKKKGAVQPISENGFNSVNSDFDQEPSITPLFNYEPTLISDQDEIIEITQNEMISEGPVLRYIGYAQLPPTIQIPISEGEIFTIGRFDAAVGKQQSNFEFEKKTKAVSRRHAVIERDGDGYKIIDLSSSAGTFVNDKKLPPNTPHGLEKGCRVSFGNSGADYVWEAS